jgi:hypothetical protein
MKAGEKGVGSKMGEISTIPKSSSNGILILREAIQTKADEKVVNTQIKALKEDVDSITKVVDGWRNLKIGGVVSVVVIVIAGVGQYFALTDSVEDNQDEISEIQETVAKVQTNVQAVKEIVEEDKRHQVKVNKAHIEAIKAAIKEAVEDEEKPRKRKPHR